RATISCASSPAPKGWTTRSSPRAGSLGSLGLLGVPACPDGVVLRGVGLYLRVGLDERARVAAVGGVHDEPHEMPRGQAAQLLMGSSHPCRGASLVAGLVQGGEAVGHEGACHLGGASAGG